MTSAEKRTRRAKIAESVERDLEKSSRYLTYWLTRNRVNGVLSPWVDIWLARPNRAAFPDGDVFWIALLPSTETAHHGRWTHEEARREVGNAVPETDLECVRVGNEPSEVQSW
ncbi:MAG: hypothetical protein ACTHU0_17080 [Kofleriaceae bacterium]